MAVLSDAERTVLRSISEAFLPQLTEEAARRVIGADRDLHLKGGVPYNSSTREKVIHEFCSRSAEDLGVADEIETLLAKHLPDDAVRELRLLLWALSTSVGTLLLCGCASPFPDLSISTREKALKSLQESMFAAKRKAFLSLKTMVALKFLTRLPSLSSTANPNWEALRYPKPPSTVDVAEAVSKQGWMEFKYNMLNPQVSGDTVLDVDVVVVGSGCGGSVMAAELSNENTVLVLEKGPYLRNAEMNGSEDQAFDQMYERGGAVTTEDTGIAVLAGATFGGGSTVNWACNIRTPEYVREEWAREHGLKRFSPASAEFTEALDAIAARLGVKDGSEVAHNKTNSLFIEGCDACGYPVSATGQNMKSVAEGAIGASEVCLGNRYGIKNSMLENFLQDAARNGCRFAEKCKVDRVIHSNARATGVVGKIQGGDGKVYSITVNARKAVVVSCGSINTPALLLRSGLPNKNGLIGKNLRLHPVCGFVAEVPQMVEVWSGAPMTTVSDVAARGTDGSHYGSKLECPAVHAGFAGAQMPWTGAEQWRSDVLRLAHAFVTIVLCRDKGSGEVRLDKNGDPRLYYPLAEHDRKQIVNGLEHCARISAAVGAERIMSSSIPIHGLCELPSLPRSDSSVEDRQKAENERQNALEKYISAIRSAGITADYKNQIFSAHQMGTAKMSSTREKGVCKDTGETWEVQGLYVADASVFPTSSGANPMWTVLALAYDFAKRLRSTLHGDSTSRQLRSKL